MQLHVSLSSWDEDGLTIDQTITSFDDLDKIASKVGRAVKSFLRAVPVRKQRSRQQFTVDATWTEAAQRAERKSKRTKKSKGEHADAG